MGKPAGMGGAPAPAHGLGMGRQSPRGSAREWKDCAACLCFQRHIHSPIGHGSDADEELWEDVHDVMGAGHETTATTAAAAIYAGARGGRPLLPLAGRSCAGAAVQAASRWRCKPRAHAAQAVCRSTPHCVTRVFLQCRRTQRWRRGWWRSCIRCWVRCCTLPGAQGFVSKQRACPLWGPLRPPLGTLPLHTAVAYLRPAVTFDPDESIASSCRRARTHL